MDLDVEPRGVAEGLALSRYLIASALSRALVDPVGVTELPEDPVWHDPQMFAEAWAMLVEGGAPPALEPLGFAEIAPGEVDAGPLYAFIHLDRDRREAVYRALFGFLGAKGCSPYETEYHQWDDATYRAQQLADVAGFQRAFGLDVSPERRDRPDHISLSLELVAFLHLKVLALEQQPVTGEGGAEGDPLAVCREALAHFVGDHVAWWVPGFGKLVGERVEERLAAVDLAPALGEDLELFGGVARLLRGWVVSERLASGIEASQVAIAPPKVAVPPPEAEGGCGESCTAC